MVCQFLRRDSRGWADSSWALPDAVVGLSWRERLERRVSCRPGAEGAPCEEVLEVWVGWVDAGAMRRDCRREPV